VIKRMVQKLNYEGVPANQIVQISGHKNINSINNYSKLNNQQSMAISDILSDSSRPKQHLASGSRSSCNVYTQFRGFL
jgi:hypothetical protein